jgi:hypothetical protein
MTPESKISEKRSKLNWGGLSWSAIRPGQRVAITAGSRGISDIAEILGAIVEFLKSLQADPSKHEINYQDLCTFLHNSDISLTPYMAKHT